MVQFQPKDFIAIISLITMLILKFRGADGQVDIAIALILGYYFAHRADGIDKGL